LLVISSDSYYDARIHEYQIRRIVALFEVRMNTFEFAVPAHIKHCVSIKNARCLMFCSDIIIIIIALQLTKSLGFQLEFFFPPVSVYISSLPHFISSFLVSPLTTSDHLDFGLPTFHFHVIFACRSLLGLCCSALHCTRAARRSLITLN
jgi:hypothetical protein